MKCTTCGSERFIFYQTITEAADVSRFEGGVAVLRDKWETTDALSSEIRCGNGHKLATAIDDPDGWNGETDSE